MDPKARWLVQNNGGTQLHLLATLPLELISAGWEREKHSPSVSKDNTTSWEVEPRWALARWIRAACRLRDSGEFMAPVRDVFSRDQISEGLRFVLDPGTHPSADLPEHTEFVARTMAELDVPLEEVLSREITFRHYHGPRKTLVRNDDTRFLALICLASVGMGKGLPTRYLQERVDPEKAHTAVRVFLSWLRIQDVPLYGTSKETEPFQRLGFRIAPTMPQDHAAILAYNLRVGTITLNEALRGWAEKGAPVTGHLPGNVSTDVDFARAWLRIASHVDDPISYTARLGTWVDRFTISRALKQLVIGPGHLLSIDQTDRLRIAATAFCSGIWGRSIYDDPKLALAFADPNLEPPKSWLYVFQVLRVRARWDWTGHVRGMFAGIPEAEVQKGVRRFYQHLLHETDYERAIEAAMHPFQNDAEIESGGDLFRRQWERSECMAAMALEHHRGERTMASALDAYEYFRDGTSPMKVRPSIDSKSAEFLDMTRSWLMLAARSHHQEEWREGLSFVANTFGWNPGYIAGHARALLNRPMYLPSVGTVLGEAFMAGEGRVTVDGACRSIENRELDTASPPTLWPDFMEKDAKFVAAWIAVSLGLGHGVHWQELVGIAGNQNVRDGFDMFVRGWLPASEIEALWMLDPLGDLAPLEPKKAADPDPAVEPVVIQRSDNFYRAARAIEECLSVTKAAALNPADMPSDVKRDLAQEVEDTENWDSLSWYVITLAAARGETLDPAGFTHKQLAQTIRHRLRDTEECGPMHIDAVWAVMEGGRSLISVADEFMDTGKIAISERREVRDDEADHFAETWFRLGLATEMGVDVHGLCEALGVGSRDLDVYLNNFLRKFIPDDTFRGVCIDAINRELQLDLAYAIVFAHEQGAPPGVLNLVWSLRDDNYYNTDWDRMGLSEYLDDDYDGIHRTMDRAFWAAALDIATSIHVAHRSTFLDLLFERGHLMGIAQGFSDYMQGMVAGEDPDADQRDVIREVLLQFYEYHGIFQTLLFMDPPRAISREILQDVWDETKVLFSDPADEVMGRIFDWFSHAGAEPTKSEIALRTLKEDSREILLRTGVKRIRSTVSDVLAQWWARHTSPRKAQETPEAYEHRVRALVSRHREFFGTDAGEALLAMFTGVMWTQVSAEVPESVRSFGDAVARELRVSAGTDLLDGVITEVVEAVTAARTELLPMGERIRVFEAAPEPVEDLLTVAEEKERARA